MKTRHAEIVWEGQSGQLKGESGELRSHFSFGSRFETNPGTNPEELLAAAEASCFTMALSKLLEKEGMRVSRMHTEAACTIDRAGDGFKITKMALSVRASGPKLDRSTLQRCAEMAKDQCPVSLALKGNVLINVVAAIEADAKQPMVMHAS